MMLLECLRVSVAEFSEYGFDLPRLVQRSMFWIFAAMMPSSYHADIHP